MKIVLDINTKLEAVLAGAVSANQPEVHVVYQDYTFANEKSTPTLFRAALNNTTDVTILAAPVANPRREVVYISVYNKDTASATVIIKTDDGTERIILRKPLATLETLHGGEQSGWYVTNA